MANPRNLVDIAPLVSASTTGNLGIGTTSPVTKLHVEDSAPILRIAGTSGTVPQLQLSSAGVINWSMRANFDGGSDFTIYQDSTQRLKIDSSGNVGIGTSSPGAKLDVNGNVHARGASFPAFKFADSSGTAEAEIYYGISANDLNIVSNQSGGVINLQTGGGVKAILNSSGNLGIGTSPSGRFDVSLPGLARLIIGSGGNTSENYYTADVQIWRRANNTEMMRLNSSGQLLINSTAIVSPTLGVTQLLQVAGGAITAGSSSSTDGTAIIYGYYGSGATAVFGSEYSSGGPVISYGMEPRDVQGGFKSTYGLGGALNRTAITVADSIKFFVSPTTSAAIGNTVPVTQAMTLDVDGNLGVGTISPMGRLDVSASGANARSLRISPTGGTDVYVDALGSNNIQINTNLVLRAFGNNNDGSIVFHTGLSYTPVERARITSSGSLLIGTTTETGVASNTAKLLAGIFATVRGSLSVAHSTTTTLVTLPSGEGNYIVSASLVGSSSPTGYNEVSIVCVSQSTSSITTLVNAATLNLSMSGLNLQVNHGQGATQTIEYSVMRIM